MDDAYRSLLSITLPVPYEEPRHQGIYANTAPGSSMLCFRVNNFDNILIEKVCKDLEIKTGTFARFCTVRAARFLEEHQNAYLNTLKERSNKS